MLVTTGYNDIREIATRKASCIIVVYSRLVYYCRVQPRALLSCTASCIIVYSLGYYCRVQPRALLSCTASCIIVVYSLGHYCRVQLRALLSCTASCIIVVYSLVHYCCVQPHAILVHGFLQRYVLVYTWVINKLCDKSNYFKMKNGSKPK